MSVPIRSQLCDYLPQECGRTNHNTGLFLSSGNLLNRPRSCFTGFPSDQSRIQVSRFYNKPHYKTPPTNQGKRLYSIFYIHETPFPCRGCRGLGTRLTSSKRRLSSRAYHMMFTWLCYTPVHAYAHARSRLGIESILKSILESISLLLE